MRNTVFFLSCLLATLWVSIALADNGVERGSIEYAGDGEIPAPVRAFIEKTMFSSCDLRGAEKIRPNFVFAQHEPMETDVNARRFKIEFAVTYKISARTETIFFDLVMLESPNGEIRVDMSNLSSNICSPTR